MKCKPPLLQRLAFIPELINFEGLVLVVRELFYKAKYSLRK